MRQKTSFGGEGGFGNSACNNFVQCILDDTSAVGRRVQKEGGVETLVIKAD